MKRSDEIIFDAFNYFNEYEMENGRHEGRAQKGIKSGRNKINYHRELQLGSE
jgi:hypothetical protein